MTEALSFGSTYDFVDVTDLNNSTEWPFDLPKETWGYITAIIAIFFFGSFNIPLKLKATQVSLSQLAVMCRKRTQTL